MSLRRTPSYALSREADSRVQGHLETENLELIDVATNHFLALV
jgi:hypothetical protein